MANNVAKGRERERGGDEGQLVGVDDPDRGFGVGVQVPGNGGQSGIGDGEVQRGHGHPEQLGGGGPAAAPGRQAIERD